jgi:hypothetical protein
MAATVIVWDIETVSDIKGFAAANGYDGKSEDDIRAAMGAAELDGGKLPDIGKLFLAPSHWTGRVPMRLREEVSEWRLS